MESQRSPEPAATGAGAAQSALRGRVFACHGITIVKRPSLCGRRWKQNEIHLLVDEAAIVNAEAGRVHILGMDFAWDRRAERMQKVCDAHPRIPNTRALCFCTIPVHSSIFPKNKLTWCCLDIRTADKSGLLSLGLRGRFSAVWDSDS